MAQRWTDWEKRKIAVAARYSKVAGILRTVFDLRNSGLRHRSAKTLIRKIKETRRQLNGTSKSQHRKKKKKG